MFKKYTYISLLIIALVFTVKAKAQEVRVIDNKGSLQTVNNNQVTQATTAPSDPLEGDIWINTSTSPQTKSVWDETSGTWIVLDTDTDDQTVDAFGFNATDKNKIEISLEDDGVAPVQFDLSATTPTDGQVLTWNGTTTQWEATTNTSGSGSGWLLTGNSITNSDFLGTLNNQDLVFKVNNNESGRISIYQQSLGLGYQTTATYRSVALGASASNTSTESVAVGYSSNGNHQSVALGALASNSNTQSVAVGYSANTGYQGTAIGYNASATNNNTTAIGHNASATQANSVILGNNADVGIGTSTPTKRLDVNGEARVRTLPAGSNTDALVSANTNGDLKSITVGNGLEITSGGVLNSTSTIAEVYLGGTSGNTNQSLSGSFQDINFGTDGIVDAVDYTTSTNSITIINPGRYEISYRVSTSANNRANGEFYLDANGSEVLGTRSYTYSRTFSVPYNTATVIKIIEITGTTTIKVRGRSINSTVVRTVNRGCSLIIKRLQ